MLLVAGIVGMPRLGFSQDREMLKKALTFYASFNESEHADVAAGDKTLFTAESLKRDKVSRGLVGDVARLDEQGKFGKALFYPARSDRVTFFKGARNVPYSRDGAYETTISFWMSLTPDEDLPEGFVDPLQITDKKWNDASLFVDFNKGKPREFRLGVYSDFSFWNPDNRKFDAIPESELPLIPVRQPPFRRNRWTHVVITLDRMNAASSDATARLYLDGKLQGALEREQRFTWEPDNVVMMLGIYYVGKIDDFAIFNRALSPTQVKQLYLIPGGMQNVLDPRFSKSQ